MIYVANVEIVTIAGNVQPGESFEPEQHQIEPKVITELLAIGEISHAEDSE